MGIDLLERITALFAAVAVLAAATLVLGGVWERSGILDDAIRSARATREWLARERAAAGELPATDEGGPQTSEVAPATSGAGTAQVAPICSAREEDPLRATAPSAHELPPGERAFVHVPWLRQVPGLRYARVREVPALLLAKYRTFGDTWELARTGSGRFVETGGVTAYRITRLEPYSALATELGLREGDELLAVNGLPIARSVSAVRALFAQLRGERRFTALVRRRGVETVLAFEVK